MQCGFVGLGAMGNPMCANLLKKGYELSVFDVNQEAVEKVVSMGANKAGSAGQLAKNAEIIFLSLPNKQIVGNVMDEILFAENRRVKIIVDLSSIGPKDSKTFAKEAAKKGVVYFDSPVSGGVNGAVNGTLTMMMGCDEEIFKEIEGPMRAIGKTMHFAGEVGAGSAVKMMNNYLSGTTMLAVCEVMIIAKKLDMDIHHVFDIINSSTGRSFTTETINEVFLDNRNFEGGFMLDLLYKDLGLSMETSKEIRFPLFIGAAAVEILEMARSYGYGKKSAYAVVKMFEDMAGVQVNE